MFSKSDNIEIFVPDQSNNGSVDPAVLITKSKCKQPLKTQHKFQSSLDKFLLQYKISLVHIKNLLKKFKLYKLCKSKKVDKLKKCSIISHKINTRYAKRRFFVKLKKKNKLKFREIKRKKQKIRNKKNEKDEPTFQLSQNDDDSVRNKIREQLELLRNCKKVDNPFINFKTKLTNVSTVATNKPLHKKELTENKTEELILNENENIESAKKKIDSPKPSTSYHLDNHTQLSPSESVESFENTSEYTALLRELNDSNIDSQNTVIEHPVDELTDSKINPTKTNDITKIKGWRNKQFLNGIGKTDDDSTKFDTNSMNVNNIAQTEISTKSAFESEALDKFLTNSKLNISYEVPKLIAEEAISSVTGTIGEYNLKFKQNTNNPTKTVLKSEKKLKAKTLAEKRKMLECNRRKDLLHEMEINETSLLKQLRRDEKKHRMEMIDSIRNSLRNQQMPITRDCWLTAMKSERNHSISQMIKYGKDNIRISGSFGGPLIYINNNEKRLEKSKKILNGNYIIVDEISSKQVNSDLRTMFEYEQDTVTKYKPGPLCKKPFLNEFVDDMWETVIVTLPKIILQVYPIYGKRIDPKIEGYLQTHLSDKGFISDIWAKFACTAVTRDRKSNLASSFDFPLKYKNDQQKVLMRKRKSIVPKSEELLNGDSNSGSNMIDDSCNSNGTKSVEYEVKKLLDDILKYLEIPDLNNSNIPYCPDCPKFTEKDRNSKTNMFPLDHNDIHTILPASNKRKLANLKTDRELKRLSVQVIEVDLESEKTKSARAQQCQKMECRLGCVCNDLSVEWPQHCGRESCILKCECRALKLIDRQKGHHFFKLPEGAELLSAETVGQIRDQAERNLAKEERKFTQTVIKANDQTIVIGEGSRQKRRRVTKLPQKYEDFLELSPEIKKVHNNSAEIDEMALSARQKLWTSSSPIYPVENQSLSVEKSNPKNEEPPIVLKQEIIPIVENMIQLKNIIPWCMVHNLYKCFCNGQALEDTLATDKVKKVIEKDDSKADLDQEQNYIAYTSKRYSTSNSFANSDANVCARIRGVPNFYLARNKSQYFKSRNSEIRDKEQQNNSTELPDDNLENKHRYFKEVGQCSSPDIIIVDPNTKPIIGISPTIEPEVPIKKTHNTKRNVTNLDESSSSNIQQTDENSQIEETRTRPLRQKRQSTKYANGEFVADYTAVLEIDKTPTKKLPMRSPATVNSTEKNKNVPKIGTPEKSKNEIESANMKIEKTKDKLTDKSKLKVKGKENDQDKLKPSKTKTDSTEDVVLKRSDSFGPLVIPQEYMLPDLLMPMAHIQNHFRSTVFKSTSSKHIFRLMTWDNLRTHYRNGSLHILYNPNTTSGKLIALKSKTNPLPSSGYIDIKYFRNSNSDELPEIVKGLISNHLPNKAFDPTNTDGQHVFGIFVFTGLYWEIRGTILKKSSDTQIVRSNETEESFQPKSVKELHLESKEVPLTVAEPEIVIDRRSPASIRVPIPIGQKNSRWFMLILENDFSILRVQKSKLCLKYSQLKQACQLAMHAARTVRFLIPRDDQAQDPNNPAFGGYAVPGLLERIFFGPYDLVESHGIMTYRYVNGKLVDTKYAEKLYGRDSKKSKGIWLYTKGMKSSGTEVNSNGQNKDASDVVDLTEDDDDIQGKLKFRPEADSSKWNSITQKKPYSSLSPDMKIRKIPIEQDPLSIQSDLSPVSNSTNSTLTKNSDLQMPVLEKIDIHASPTKGKDLTKMPTLQPIHSSHSKKMPTLQPINDTTMSTKTLSESTPLNSTISTSSLPIYYESRISTKRKRNSKDKLTNNKGNDDLEIISSAISTTPKNRTMWLISELPNLGYIEIKTFANGKISLQSPTNKRVMEFNEMGLVIDWIDQLLRRFICFVPVDFQIHMYLVDDKKAIAGRKPLEETELRGYHLICAKGLFDITELTPLAIEDLGISIRECDNILKKVENLTLQKYIYKLGDMFLPVETMRSMLHETIVNMASPAIRRLQKENIKLKKEKRDLTLENERLQQNLNNLSKELNLNESKRQEIFSRELVTDSEDDDVIIIEDTNVKESNVKDTSEKDPLAITVEDTLKISNVTSLSDGYKQRKPASSESTAQKFEPVVSSCTIINGKKYSSFKFDNRKKVTENTAKTPPVIDYDVQITKNVVTKIPPITTSPNKKTENQMFAPITLPNGQSVLVPIMTQTNKTLTLKPISSLTNTTSTTNTVTKSTTKSVAVAKKRTSLLDYNSIKSTSTLKKQNLTNSTVKNMRKIQSKTQSILKMNVSAPLNNSKQSAIIESEIIEID